MAYDSAATYLSAALDHMRAWRTLLHAGEVPTYAHFSLLRTAHESALIALWLLEPGLLADERRARGLAAQMADYEEKRKFQEDMAVMAVPPPAQTAAQRPAHLLKPDSTEGFLVSGNLAFVPGRLGPESEARRVEWGWDGPLAW
jgi:hypothetical protein